jgi:ribose-phosphate pyrophosphokinase
MSVSSVAIGNQPVLYCLPQATSFASNVSQEIKKLMPDEFDCLSHMTVRQFANSESCVQIPDTVRGNNVYLIGWSKGSVDTLCMQLFIAIDAFKRASANKVIVVLPMMPYARQDRKDASRMPITARMFASFVETAGANHVITMDLHASQIQGFYKIPVDNLYSSPTMCAAILKQMDGDTPTCVVSPDAGGVKRARDMHARLRSAGVEDLSLCMIHKERGKDGDVEEMTVVGNVKGKNCWLIDDMADTCGTLCKAAQTLKDHGANKVMAAITHGVFSRNALERIDTCDALSSVFVSDTCLEGPGDWGKSIQVHSVAGVFASAIYRNHNHMSVKDLFEGKPV